MASITVEDLRNKLARMPAWFEVTVTDGEAHFDISGVVLVCQPHPPHTR